MKKRIIVTAAITACLALCAAVWPQAETVEKTPAPSETTAVTTPRPTLPETEELVLPAITEKQESGMPEAESAPEVAAKELPTPAPEIEDEAETEQKSAPPTQTEPAPVHPTQSESAPEPIANDNELADKAANAVIARSREIAELLPSELISELINGKRHYEWLPVSLTETGPYKDVLSYFSSILGIEVIRPEDLRSYFNDNHSFLENRDNDWLVRLYKLYETVPNIFSESNYRNILDAVIVRTASNRIVAPYRKSQSSYLPNVFLPSKKAMQAEVEFVHPYLFEKCRTFFENVLHLKTPNEYEHFVKSLEKRYAGTDFSGSFEEHVQDIHALVKYLRNSDYEADLRQIVRKAFYIKCRSGGKAYWARPHSKVIRFPQSETGLMLEQYYKGIAPDIYFVDFDAYQSAGITFDDLRALGVTDKIITGDEKTWGEYYTGNPGRQPEWRTTGDFRWKLGIDKLEEALLYISQHAKAKDALIKSQVIFKTLQENMSRLVGTVYIGGGTPNKYDEPADVIHTLNRDGFNWRFSDWNGKWLYNEAN